MMRRCSRSPTCPICIFPRGRGRLIFSASAGSASSIGSAGANTCHPPRRARSDHARSEKASRSTTLAVTGDLVNFSVIAEYARARAWLETLGPPAAMSRSFPAITTFMCRKRSFGPRSIWGDYMQGDDGAAPGTFPFLRRRGPVALIALSTALPTAPFFATGRLGDKQLSLLADALDKRVNCFASFLSIIRRSARPAAICGACRRRGVSPCAGGKRRRTRAPRPRSLFLAHLARRAG